MKLAQKRVWKVSLIAPEYRNSRACARVEIDATIHYNKN